MHHYQGLVRVPTLWIEPGTAPSVRDDLISTIDFPTTILKRAGLQPFNGAMGRDFFGDPEPDGLIIEEQAGRPQPGSANPPGLRTLVTRNHRMTLSPDDNFSELYDLAEDPNENINLFNAQRRQPVALISWNHATPHDADAIHVPAATFLPLSGAYQVNRRC